MCLSTTFWRTEKRTVVIPMKSQFGCPELLITRTFLSGPVKFEITRVDCILTSREDLDQTVQNVGINLNLRWVHMTCHIVAHNSTGVFPEPDKDPVIQGPVVQN